MAVFETSLSFGRIYSQKQKKIEPSSPSKETKNGRQQPLWAVRRCRCSCCCLSELAREHHCALQGSTMKDVTATEKRVGVDGTVEHVSLPRIRLVGFLSLVISLSLVIFDQLRAMPRMMETTRTSEIKESIHISRIKGLTIEVASTPAVPRPILPLSDLDLHGNCIPVQDRRPLLPPLEMLKIYISQHSEQSLWRDWEANNTHHRVSGCGRIGARGVSSRSYIYIRCGSHFLFVVNDTMTTAVCHCSLLLSTTIGEPVTSLLQ